MPDEPYTKTVTHQFEAGGTGWAILYHDTKGCEFEETRKNGQEDTHIWGEAAVVDGKWVLKDDTREMIGMYESDHTADAVEAFFNEHGMPKD
jgi:hypothetical protein